VAAAQDTGGEAAAGPWYDAAKATFTTLVDTQHAASSAFQLINVPSGIWIDEQGHIVRPGESAWTSDKKDTYGGKELVIHGDAYVAGLRDWVANGAQSPYVLSDDEYAKGVWFQQTGDRDRAAKYFERAQQLNPDDWNYHRQDWSFGPNAGRKWLEKFQKTDKEYYPLDMKPDPKKKGAR
jgi:tetratricopeptide (TPR) repeat protein